MYQNAYTIHKVRILVSMEYYNMTKRKKLLEIFTYLSVAGLAL